MEKAWAIIIDDDQAACMMAIPRLFEQLRFFVVFLCCNAENSKRYIPESKE
ncbi:hypothetical protein [Endozoicomonas atrinae]|uniref:hypothetical protein n=1 Tax=Endozoicomonas atrinae TaxID=1333660 RepID=UPI003AFFC4D8